MAVRIKPNRLNASVWTKNVSNWCRWNNNYDNEKNIQWKNNRQCKVVSGQTMDNKCLWVWLSVCEQRKCRKDRRCDWQMYQSHRDASVDLLNLDSCKRLCADWSFRSLIGVDAVDVVDAAVKTMHKQKKAVLQHPLRSTIRIEALSKTCTILHPVLHLQVLKKRTVLFED